MRPINYSFRRAFFAAAVAGALAFGAREAFARAPVAACTNPNADTVCYNLRQCDDYCHGIGSLGGGCYQGCCFCA